MDIKGCVGLVTGGNRGIGEAFVRELLHAGAFKFLEYVETAARAAKTAAAWALGRFIRF